ncbi:hypothetical protein B6R96_00145 [Streptomyces sp. Sge12]|uniref:hypothetical protein n=1 Tax=Streptomyces sp. Sge12 TaxID=1972846 RepID=UPI0009C2FF88|nr:hypothetical protein [Streptomyces sp. Sge12]ARE72557.1 hypothetical protein B6R96_00145 [Streptomyces sp. Sge12]
MLSGRLSAPGLDPVDHGFEQYLAQRRAYHELHGTLGALRRLRDHPREHGGATLSELLFPLPWPVRLLPVGEDGTAAGSGRATL